ncbi:MAG: ABC transporter permease [Spirochaetaceae bacterium]|nr:ABC transporter permease [Spirochaetaceae bacterium]
MFKNYILLTLRNISRNKVSSLIAIAGLSLGIASALLLYLFIDYQISFDKFFPGNNIKRLIVKTVDHDLDEYYKKEAVRPHTAGIIKENVPSIEEMSIYYTSAGTLHIHGENFWEAISYVDSNFFDIIPFKILEGKREILLNGINSIVLNKEIAEKLFPQGDALGQTAELKDKGNYLLKVTGIIETPSNSHLYRGPQVFIGSNILMEIAEEPLVLPDEWRVGVYFIPVEGYDEQVLSQELKNLSDFLPQDEDFKSVDFFYEDFEDIHLFSKEHWIEDPSNPLIMLIFLGILTLALLFITIINTISILTAQSITRTKEVGIRKVLGSNNRDLIFQFLAESIILSFISLILALLIAELLLPIFSNIVLVELNINCSLSFISFIILLTLLIGITSGLYPAFYLSSLKVVDSIKGKNLLKLGKFRKALVLSLFFFSSFFLVWALSINNEVQFIRNIDVGFNKENIMAIHGGYEFLDESNENLLAFKEEVKKLTGIVAVSFTSNPPFCYEESLFNQYLDADGVTKTFEQFVYVDKDYFELMGFTTDQGLTPQNNSAVVFESINNYRDISIGDLIEIDSEAYPVDSVIEAYYLESPIYYISKNVSNNLIHIVGTKNLLFTLIRVSPDVDINRIKAIWNSFFPELPFEYVFISDQVEYDLSPDDSVKTMILVFNISVYITLFISLLGLFGLILHTVKQKTKEIGIRKVMGAGFFSIISQILRESLSLIFIAAITGVPLGVYTVKNLLFFFGYPVLMYDLARISIFSAIVIISTGTLFIIFMVINAARSNPSDALRYE